MVSLKCVFVVEIDSFFFTLYVRFSRRAIGVVSSVKVTYNNVMCTRDVSHVNCRIMTGTHRRCHITFDRIAVKRHIMSRSVYDIRDCLGLRSSFNPFMGALAGVVARLDAESERE